MGPIYPYSNLEIWIKNVYHCRFICRVVVLHGLGDKATIEPQLPIHFGLHEASDEALKTRDLPRLMYAVTETVRYSLIKIKRSCSFRRLSAYAGVKVRIDIFYGL